MAASASARRRQSIRLSGRNYAGPGTYFLTLCTHDREPLFGEIADGTTALNECGTVVAEEWRSSARLRPELVLDAFVVMPNHLHAVVALRGAPTPHSTESASGSARPSRSLGSFVAGFKAAATAWINTLRDSPGVLVWQRGYYERVVRGGDALTRIRAYIAANPRRWQPDGENPGRIGDDPFDRWLSNLSVRSPPFDL